MPSRKRWDSERRRHNTLLSRLAYKLYQTIFQPLVLLFTFDLYFTVNTCGAKKVGKSIGSTGRETLSLVLKSGDWRTCRSACETRVDCVGWVLVDRRCIEKLKGHSKASFLPASSTSISAICTPSHLINPGSDPDSIRHTSPICYDANEITQFLTYQVITPCCHYQSHVRLLPALICESTRQTMKPLPRNRNRNRNRNRTSVQSKVASASR